uniref:ATPase ASNA1 homolog n=1 Tax=Trieres chinensis TaxID=1514140 RepID=A0A7S2A7V6_TRICV|mmetsp:Transcript_5951/g.12427  ORF Transcript_5951/g.12427 Transcript_5951/m.12427 type:complete len:365 (+) Transcript_5951:189-1283(+)
MAEFDDSDLPDPSLKNILEQESLQWVFVGGKGGVGKTTTSCCLGVQLAKVRKRVLIVSTDPAHNLSDAFCQKIGREPTPITGFTNLCAMEIDANDDMEKMQQSMEEATGAAGGGGPDSDDSGINSLMAELTSSIPGIDEAMSFAELMKQVQGLDYDVVVFDTAPTGHTLRLLSFPTILEKALGKVMELKDRFGGLIGQASALFGGGSPGQIQEMLVGRLEETRAVINKVNDAFQDPDLTTFVCVCIPEFLSIYETERLVQELSKFGIDSHNIVVNQVLFPEKDAEELEAWLNGNLATLPREAREICSKMMARKKMQDKYIGQCFDLYGDDFSVVLMPLLDYEVRGVERLKEFSESLVDPVDLET